jgi:glyoxylase-like metal-dependent hydrolase (beta-lactamase superfamily II)
MLVVGLFGVLAVSAPASADEARYKVEKLADNVYVILYNPEIDVEGNTLVVINDEDVFVVDANSGITTAKLAIEEIKKLTPKPVRYLVNTHWHDDHVMGNQVYADTYPGVQIIAHPLTRQDIIEHAFANNAFVLDLIHSDIKRLQGYLDTKTYRDGKPVTGELKTRIEAALRSRNEALPDRKALRAVPPNLDVADSLTLKRGGREIQVRFLGRGNTRGDLVVYLPKEKVLATGDLVVAPLPYATNVYAQDWVKTLDALMAIPATTIVPGHGPVMHDWTYVKKVQGALQQTISAVASAKRLNLSLKQTLERVQLPELKESFVNGVELRRNGYEAFFRSTLVRNIWEELDPAVMKAYSDASLQKVADGVYAYDQVKLLVNEKDVIIVNVPASAAAAQAAVRAIRELTDKPVRYIVRTTLRRENASLDVLREAYTQAEVIAGDAAGAQITVSDAMTLHRGDREIRITRIAEGLTVELTRERVRIAQDLGTCLSASSTRSRSCAAVNGFGSNTASTSDVTTVRSW